MSKYDHIILPSSIIEDMRYSPKNQGGGESRIPIRERKTHAQYLQNKLSTVWDEHRNMVTERTAISLPTRKGTYIEFRGATNNDLIYKSLENINSGIRLLNVRTITVEEGEDTYATVYLPQGKEHSFIKKITEYATQDTAKGKPKNDKLFRSIEDIKSAVLESIWTDKIDLFPSEQNDWYEIWIRITEDNKTEQQCEQFVNIVNSLQLNHKDKFLQFPERAVFMIFANRSSLIELLNRSEQLAEIRCGQETTGFWYNENRYEQQTWVNDLLSRLIVENQPQVSVCVLDTGVNNGHPLLSPIIPDDKCLTNFPHLGSADFNRGHGTQMCGVVAYGDLSEKLLSTQNITLSHQLCSVKIIPNSEVNPKELWGELTENSIYRTEIVLPNNKIYCMAITAESCEKGKPSSWSGAVDKLAYNTGINTRLIIISGGNIDLDSINYDLWNNYPNGNSLRQIQNPAQSWNALTIGAHTNKLALNNHRLADFSTVAPSGGISPYSTTSILWDKNAPIKPEIMFEGGNLYKTNDETIPYSNHEDLEVLTTNCRFQIGSYFDTICATSSATAFAANLAARLQLKYPDLWMESIRALMVHSANWSENMQLQFPVRNRNRADMMNRLRNCGYGIPSEDRAFYSTENGFTYISQEVIRPYIKEKGTIKCNQMHFYELPWPSELLQTLGEIEVSLRITLSYFIEPGPGEIGWKDKYKYSSCGLRFDINQETETEENFKRRINKLMEAEDNEEEIIQNDSTRWYIGANNRNQGSIHSDILYGTAAQLSTCNYIAIYPIGGWWKTRTNLNRFNSNLRYSLVVSLDTPAENVDLYNIVKTKIEALIRTPINIEIPTN